MTRLEFNNSIVLHEPLHHAAALGCLVTVCKGVFRLYGNDLLHVLIWIFFPMIRAWSLYYMQCKESQKNERHMVGQDPWDSLDRFLLGKISRTESSVCLITVEPVLCSR